MGEIVCPACEGSEESHNGNTCTRCLGMGKFETNQKSMDGFLGVRAGVLFSVERDGHMLTVANYSFPDGTVHPYIEASETHDGVRGPLRVLALSTAVHLIQNATEDEVFEIGGREPGEAHNG